MKHYTIKNKYLKYNILSFMIVLITWKILTLYFPPLVVPTISSVIKALIEIFTNPNHIKMIGLTVFRLFCGISIGTILGLILGIAMGVFEPVKNLLSPIINLFQTIPPVSWVVLALVWFGFNGIPSIFIVVISTLPILSINICEGIINIDRNLLEMTEIYRFGIVKKFRYLLFPSIYPYFSSAFKISLAGASKITVMGEVLTTSDGIGGMIKVARLNIEPDYIIAWSITIVLIFYVMNFLLGLCKSR